MPAARRRPRLSGRKDFDAQGRLSPAAGNGGLKRDDNGDSGEEDGRDATDTTFGTIDTSSTRRLGILIARERGE